MKNKFSSLTLAILAACHICHAQQIIPSTVPNFVPAIPPGIGPAVVAASDDVRIRSLALFGVGGLDDITKLNESGGSASVGINLNIGRGKGVYDNTKGEYSLQEGTLSPGSVLYMAFNAKAANTSDSSSFARIFLFPDISKRDFTLGFGHYWYLSDQDWTIQPYCEFSTSRNILTMSRNELNLEDTTIRFRSFSMIAGTRIDFQSIIPIGSENKTVGISLIPYYNLITVDSKDFVGYNYAFKETDLPPSFHTIGLKAILSLSNFAIFGNLRQVLNYDRHYQTNDLKGFNVIVGAVVDANIFRHTKIKKL